MFKNKVCVITGGALGIGRCLTREFAKNGSKIAFIDINENAGNTNLEYLKSNNSKALFYHGDLAKLEDLKEFSSLVVKEFGSIDILINSGAINNRGIHSSCNWDNFNEALKVGVTAPYYLTFLFLSHFNKNSSVVNIVSTRAFMSQADTESYSAAKGALYSLTHALSISLAHKVRVNSVAPGWIDTNRFYDEKLKLNITDEDIGQHPANRIGKAEDVAKAVMFLCDENNSFINGENIIIDGGMSKLMIYNNEGNWSYNK